jgi:hypothetical protein
MGDIGRAVRLSRLVSAAAIAVVIALRLIRRPTSGLIPR